MRIRDRLAHSWRAAAIAGALLAASAILSVMGPARPPDALAVLLLTLPSSASWPWVAAMLSPGVAPAVSRALLAAAWALLAPSALLELAFGLAALRVDTHTLMTAAALATVPLGCATEGALLLCLFQLSHAVEASLARRVGGDLARLLEGSPTSAARVIPNRDDDDDKWPDRFEEVPASALEPGDRVVVSAGGGVPADAVVVLGEALVSAEHVTGEAAAFRAPVGTLLPAGSSVVDAPLVLRVERTADQSAPARVLSLTREAQARRPSAARAIDAFSATYSRVVLAIALSLPLVLRVSFLEIPLLGVRGGLYRSAGFLAAAAPCALAAATLPYPAALAALARRGLLVRGGDALDALASARHLCLDKTGTLTTGELSTVDGSIDGAGAGAAASMATLCGGEGLRAAESRRALWAAAGTLSALSSHPVSRAVAAAAVDEVALVLGGPDSDGADGPRLSSAKSAEIVPGRGVLATVIWMGGEWMAALGSPTFCLGMLPANSEAATCLAAWASAAEVSGGPRAAVVLTPVDAVTGESSREGGTPVALGIELADTPREGAADALWALRGAPRAPRAPRELRAGDSSGPSGGTMPLPPRWRLRPGLAVHLLTGDHSSSALAAVREADAGGALASVTAGLAPEDKLKAVEAIREGRGPPGGPPAPGGGVIMVGDGLNDAPALAAADCGVAFSPAGDAGGAAAAADVVLLVGGDPTPPLARLALLVAAARRARVLAAQNVALALISVALSALPVAAGWTPLWVAVLVHEGSTVAVTLNSLRALRLPRGSRN